jgi:hypothetical protein
LVILKFLPVTKLVLTATACLFLFTKIHSQEFSKDASIALFTGLMNYQGDLNPNSFTYRHSKFAVGLIVRKPLSRLFALRAGLVMGELKAGDHYNRDYLRMRNLSFFSSIKEAHAGLEITLTDIPVRKVTPYVYAGIAVFHFNPWAYDLSGNKTYLQPLGTEGQGLPQYPGQKPYKLTQLSLPFGGGARFAITESITLGLEISQRKSFTDYIDDVSTHYVDEETLLGARGAKAVEMAYRSNQVGGPSYPAHGEQRGTPTEMDWYYFFGTTLEVKFNRIGDIFKSQEAHVRSYQQRCPRNVRY